MKNQNPPKKLSLLKKTIAHLNTEQMNNALGGLDNTYRACTVTYIIDDTTACDSVLQEEVM